MKVPLRETAGHRVSKQYYDQNESTPTPFEEQLNQFLSRQSKYSGRHVDADSLPFRQQALQNPNNSMIEAPYGGVNATPAEILSANPPADAIMGQLAQYMPGGTMGDTPTQSQSMIDDDFIKMLQREVNQGQLDALDWSPQENYPEETGRGMRHPNPFPIDPSFTGEQTIDSGVAQEIIPNNRTEQILRKLRPSNETIIPKSPSVEDLLRSLGGR